MKKSRIRKLIEEYDSSANTFSSRVNELHKDLEVIDTTRPLNTKNKMRDFLIHEKMIRNDELFWIMFGSYYIGTPQNYQFKQEIIDAIERGTRLELPLSKRMRLSNQLKSDSHKELEENIQSLSSFIAKHTADEDITIYRGFLVPEGREIRKGRFVDEPSSHIQVEGLGFSFSFDKRVAIVHSIMNTSSAMLLRLYGDELGDKSFRTWWEFFTAFQKLENSKEMLEKTLKYAQMIKLIQGGDSTIASEYVGFNVRPCIAKCSIKKSDIKSAHNFVGTELELFCYPSDQFFWHYEFTSWKHQMKEWKEKALFPNMMESNIAMIKKVSEIKSLDEFLNETSEGIKLDEIYFAEIKEYNEQHPF